MLQPMGDNNPTEYVWHPLTNRSFNARCHIESGNTWLQFEFKSDIGRIAHPKDVPGNPIFIVSDGGKTVLARGAVTIPANDTEQMGTITFTPQDEGVTEWHWTLTRDGETHTEEGRGMFRPDEPKVTARSRVRKPAARRKKAVTKRKPAGAKATRPKAASKKKPAGRKKPASKKRPVARKKLARGNRRSKR
jgi:hypothetical protein